MDAVDVKHRVLIEVAGRLGATHYDNKSFAFTPQEVAERAKAIAEAVYQLLPASKGHARPPAVPPRPAHPPITLKGGG